MAKFVRALMGALALAGLGMTGLGMTSVGMSATAWAQKETLTMGSTNAASSNYALAVAMTKAIKKELPNVNVSMIETGASVDNIRRMTKGEIDFGLVMVDTSIQAVDGTGAFKGKAVPDLAVLYAYDATALQFAVRADAGINDLKDLQGKKFNAGIRGSGAEVLTRQIFAALGIEPNWVSGSIQDSVEGVQNRQLVGYAKYGVGSGGLDATMRELLTSTPMKFIGLTEEQHKIVAAKVKGVDFTTIPADTIPGQPAALSPMVYGTYSTRTSLMDDATAYAVAKAIYENRQFLVDVFPHLAHFDFKNATLKTEALGLHVHPGAKKFWETVK
ncbi:MAG: TAXI family TRAP transporter solute-binding subunit [Rhodospirillales bacterium]|nr:TAXI family TRAP transporter solute-binding subunit [Rhodospirillales bacterium]